eukprot:7160826-Alexandrium_andersonii.AAC.1
MAHALTHMPFRTWRPACVKARAQEGQRKKQRANPEDCGYPKVSMDYCYTGIEEEEKAPALV